MLKLYNSAKNHHYYYYYYEEVIFILNYIIVYKLSILDGNTWNDTTVLNICIR